VSSSSLSFQLNDREQLYASILPGKCGVDRVGKDLGFFERGMRRLAPDQIAVRRVRQAARDRLIDPGLDAVEPFGRAFAGQERLVTLVDRR